MCLCVQGDAVNAADIWASGPSDSTPDSAFEDFDAFDAPASDDSAAATDGAAIGTDPFADMEQEFGAAKSINSPREENKDQEEE
jgi:hypothetical protein